MKRPQGPRKNSSVSQNKVRCNLLYSIVTQSKRCRGDEQRPHWDHPCVLNIDSIYGIPMSFKYLISAKLKANCWNSERCQMSIEKGGNSKVKRCGYIRRFSKWRVDFVVQLVQVADAHKLPTRAPNALKPQVADKWWSLKIVVCSFQALQI
ncbi:hypothetical protein MAR_023532 [Mya arenaria]|uniref:Uncharacterized protein n=1 Tax=Mya arenaria TaxID=6604 RepID=A0ABY7DP35_MYAAR|nr:hypothetical protein MAR_023532 [Mya arenaria]